eukprot:CAMPEP_0184005906 /NCGR_PEP_ID=MMETSP0954-20121128/345_1 /TAXON_ID=627963 /ORGANISM="Aplanochytrium sp, Strain PBS07" /LENGTH=373 /DNA_ID=CAMNT_0026284291 /DNA_START=272 /DNA_END=1390 /DNA_ORIENTATION=+
MKVNYCKTVSTNRGSLITPEALYDLAIQEYNQHAPQGGQYYEIFDTNETLVKPHFDYERYVPIDDYTMDTADKFLESKIEILRKAFKVDKNQIAVAKDCRKVLKKDTDFIKVSFHFVVKGKKLKMTDLRVIASQLKDPDLDLNIYRQGINKFRMPYTKKSPKDKDSILRPLTDDTRETFKNHLVSYIEGCELIVAQQEESTPQTTKRNDTQDNQEKGLSKADLERITGETVIGNIKRESRWYIFDIAKLHCGVQHDSNHNYACFNTDTGEYNVRCHSVNCSDFNLLKSTGESPIQRSTFDFSHQEIVDAFLRTYGDQFRYDQVEKEWYSWNGTLWQQDKAYFPLKMKELTADIQQVAGKFFAGDTLVAVKKQA